MPTYEYACDACDHAFEEFQSIKAKPIVVCPKCRKRKVKRLISAGAGFIFKGSGFYITDYRTDSYKAGAKSDTTASTAASPSNSAGADSKPAASTPTPSAPAKSESKSSSKSKKS